MVSGTSPGARQEVDKQLVLSEMVCPRDKVGMDFPGFLFWKRAGYMCSNLFSPLVVQTFKSLSHDVRQHHSKTMVAEAQSLFGTGMQQHGHPSSRTIPQGPILLCSCVSLDTGWWKAV